MDHRLGRFMNHNYAEYHVPVNADIDSIDVIFVDEPDTEVSPLGVKGLGELGIVGTAAAVANAIFHATGISSSAKRLERSQTANRPLPHDRPSNMTRPSSARLNTFRFAMAFAVAGLAACTTGRPASDMSLTRVAAFEHQVTGVTVSSDGRVFVNFPRWTEDNAVSVGELKDGRVVPYPDADWNAWRNARKDEVSAADHWVCVQSVVVDGRGNLWVLDPAAPAMGTLVPGGPKLVQIDLQTNRPRRTITFDETVAPQGAYLNDVRFSPDGNTAFLTDSGAKGALIVVDLQGGKARRVLDGHPSTQPDKSVTVRYDGKPLRRPDGRGVEFAADGIALTPDGSTLYWQAIKGKTLYSLPTEALRSGATDADLAGRIKVAGENGPADGLLISKRNGLMYVSSPEDDSVKWRDPSVQGGPLNLLVRDARLRWPDTFAEGPDGTIYVTTSHIQDSAFFKPGAPAALPTELWSIRPASR